MNRRKLTIEVPPRSLPFFSFSHLCQELDCSYLWKKFRRAQKRNQAFKCYYCGAKGRLELHEFLRVNDRKRTVKFCRPRFLCHPCHSVKNLYYGIALGPGGEPFFTRNGMRKTFSVSRKMKSVAREQFLKINRCSFKEFRNYMQNIAQLVKKRWHKDYQIEFDEVYKPLINEILNHPQGRYVKVHEWYVRKFENTLNLLKETVKRKDVACFIIMDGTRGFIYKVLKENDEVLVYNLVRNGC